MIEFIKFVWKHYVKLEHEPEHYLNDNEAYCVCGKRIAKDNRGNWYEL
jgi:hypothetical protein